MGPDAQQEQLAASLEQALSGVDTSDHDRLARALSAFYSDALEEARGRFDAGHLGSPCSRFISAAADMVVMSIRDAVAGSAPGSWVAVGAYGRGLLSPGSRINLIVLEADESESAEARARAVLVMLRAAAPNSEVAWGTPKGILQRLTGDVIAASDLLETRLVAGSEELYDRFRRSFTDDFLVPRWGRFCADLLEESLSQRDPYTSSPYCTEPNLKEGTGCLRDIGMMQKLAAALPEVPALNRFLAVVSRTDDYLLTCEESEALDEAFEFILSARNALHFLAAGRSDVLERGLQAEAARAMGYAHAPEAEAAVTELMRDLFRHTGRVSRILRTFGERLEHLRSVAWQKPKLRPRRDIGDGFAVVEGNIYNALRPPFSKENGAHRMMRAFLLSQRQHIPMSQQLLDQVAEHLNVLDEEKLWARRTAETFLDLLRGSVGVAERLRWMRDCALLQRYIPEFEQLVHVVHYEESFDYTLDEHAIEATGVIDELAHTDQEDEVAQRELLSQVERPDLLRLALLLHHVVRQTPEDPAFVAEAPGRGSRSPRPSQPKLLPPSVAELLRRTGRQSRRSGAAGTSAQQAEQLMREVGRRMYLSGSEIATLCFLVTHRNMLTYYAERRDFHEPRILQEAAAEVGTPQKLRLLYLFSYANCRAIGRAGWFAWRDALLYELFQHLMAALVPDFQPRATVEYFDEELLRLAREADLLDEARHLASIVPERYKIEVTPSEALEHLELIGKIQTQPAAIICRVQGRQARLWFCTSDLPARFSQIAGSLTYNDLSIIRARAFTLADGTILDNFLVHRQDLPMSSDPQFWQKVESDLVASVSGQLDLSVAIREMARSSGTALAATLLPSRRDVASVRFDNESSPEFTILDVVCWDRAGLLYSLSRALSEAGVNIEFAKISTRLDLAQDVFYVNDSRSGKKLTGKKRLSRIRTALTRAARAEG